MQLSRTWLAGLAAVAAWVALALWPRGAKADDKARAAVTYFQEPAASTPLTVIHPQVAYSQDFKGKVGLDLGYDADIVSGATPQIFGIDAVTSATRFRDQRHSGAGSLRFLNDFATLRVGGGYAGERDYRSGTISIGAATDLFNRNTQLALDYTHNFDRVCDASNPATQDLLELRALDESSNCYTDSDLTTSRKLSIDTVQGTWTQIVSPWLVIQSGVTGQHLSGFQANPYRQVFLGRRAVQEHVPEVRNRLAAFLRAKIALKPIRGSIDASTRFYTDSWSVHSFTGELGWNQYLARPLVARLRARYHLQDSAIFYRDGNEYAASGPVGSYWTGDRELSALMNTLVGAKITYLWRAQARPALKFIDGISVSAKVDLLFYRSLTRNPRFSPNWERTQGLLDAVVAQLQVGIDF